MRTHLYFWLLLLVVFPAILPAQITVKGRIADSETKEPLAFANVTAPATGQGIMTDIDGKFSVTFSASVDSFLVSFVGYQKKLVPVKGENNYYHIRLKPVHFELSEVTVQPGKNPAHRIIKKAVENRKANNPESRGAFILNSYNKLVAKPHEKLAKIDTSEADTLLKAMKKRFSDKNIFIMETVSRRFFEAPDKVKEKVLHTQVSGLKTPFFFLLASQLQSFTFYEDLVNIGGMHLVNPISRGSTKKYWFRIEDTTYVHSPQDTVYTISFRKRGDRSFQGMKGVLQIGSRDYAIRTVIASPAKCQKTEPVEENDSTKAEPQKCAIDVKIQQKYKKVQDEKWFPVQLNMDITLNNFRLGGGIPLKLEGRTYIKDVELNDNLKNSIFDENYMEMDRQAAIRNDSLVAKYRKDSLSQKDRNTYAFVDSMSEKHNLEKTIKTYQILRDGYIPWGPVNIALDKIVDFNVYEGWRFGLGLTTNNDFSSVLTPSIYGAWSARDHKWKYGGGFEWKLWDEHDLYLKTHYHNDIRERGELPVFEDKGLLSSYEMRGYLPNKMDDEKVWEASLKFRTLKYAELETGFRKRALEFNDNYFFGSENATSSIGLSAFETSELFVKLRYAFRERYIKTPLGKHTLGSEYPVLWFNYTLGTNLMDGQLAYEKYNFQLQKDFQTRYFGSTSLLFRGGLVSDDIPLSLQYTAFGSYYPYTLACPGTFNTMRINEYAANEYLSFHFSHDFKKHLFRSKHFQPRISLHTSAVWGRWSGEQRHKNAHYKSLESGFYESGILIRNLLKGTFAGLGVGYYYRWGPERLGSFKKNSAIKFVIGLD